MSKEESKKTIDDLAVAQIVSAVISKSNVNVRADDKNIVIDIAPVTPYSKDDKGIPQLRIDDLIKVIKKQF